ncbi:MAG: hypothetical protein ACT4P3_11375 [Betaproteobacteria bacterium]
MSDPAYDRAWARLRSAVRMLRIAEGLWMIPVGVFVLGIVGFELVPNTLDWRGPLWWIFLGLLAGTVGVRVVADIRVKRFRCPRCAKPFVRLSLLQRSPLHTIERRFPCQHCNLPAGAASGDAAAA